MRIPSLVGIVVGMTFALSSSAGADDGPPGSVSSIAEEDRVLHLLNRATFGPTADLVDEVHRVGRNAWVTEQVFPQNTADPELEEKLSIYPALTMSASELLENYPNQRKAQMGIGRPGRVPVEVASANLTRAVHAKAQLQEVLTDFWFNHFNIASQDGPIRHAVVSYVRDAIRPNVLGYFEDLLRATAESVAMLYYLDNYVSSAPGSRGPNSGINENYARELLELHTLGVDGGYTQDDVVEVARAFTGWTISPRRSGVVEFIFVPRLHDPGDKTVLGQTIRSGGQSEGLEILHMLATHPSTAEFLSRKLLQRFVADDPPQSFVDKTANVYLTTGGHIGWTIMSILTNPEFYRAKYQGNKAKTPLELVASALRVIGGDVSLGVSASQLVGDLGQPMLRAEPPTGWPETSAQILSPGGMVTRFEFGYLATSNRIEGVRIDSALWEPILDLWGTDGLAQFLLGKLPAQTTREALATARSEGAAPELLAAMVLGSPEFQLQ